MTIYVYSAAIVGGPISHGKLFEIWRVQSSDRLTGMMKTL
jgi:hypothetical protein